MATPRCQHTFPAGRRCGSPALRNEQFCFYHHPTGRPARRIQPSLVRFDLPLPTDRESLHQALSEVLCRLADGTLDTKRAGILLQLLQMAQTNLANPATFPAGSPRPKSPDFSDIHGLIADFASHLNPSAP
jgi:hypothetical protein